MDTKLVHRKVVRNSILEAIQGIGTAAIGGSSWQLESTSRK
jgi:hypothetical protein